MGYPRSNSVVNGVPGGATSDFDATETGFNAVSVKAAATVAGNILDLSGFKHCMVSIAFDSTGSPSTGLAKLVVDVYDEDAAAFLPAFDLITSMNLKADNTVVVSFGGDQAAEMSYSSGSPSLASNADVLRVLGKIKFSITTTEAHDGTSVTATMKVMAGA